jgi:hypothetical protein
MILYLHGFASSPASSKARFFAEHFRALGEEVIIPALDGGDFESLTLSRQLRIAEQAGAGRPLTLMGSSMGGYLAALYAARHQEVERLILMAPAFDFANRWRQGLGEEKFEQWQKTGYLEAFHYATNQTARVGFALYLDALSFEPYPTVTQPALLFHGTKDDVVPLALSQEFVRRCPHARLKIFSSGHELTEVVEPMWNYVQLFLAL